MSLPYQISHHHSNVPLLSQGDNSHPKKRRATKVAQTSMIMQPVIQNADCLDDQIQSPRASSDHYLRQPAA